MEATDPVDVQNGPEKDLSQSGQQNLFMIQMEIGSWQRSKN